MQVETENNGNGFDAEWESAAANLPRVEAPAYFNERVTARINERVHDAPGPSYAFLKLLVPVAVLGGLMLFFLITGYVTNEIEPLNVVYDNSNSSDADDILTPSASENEGLASAPAAESSPQESGVSRNSAAIEKTDERAGLSSPSEDSAQTTQNRPRSQDSGLRPAERDIAPRGLDTNPQRPGSATGPQSHIKVRVLDVLRFAGVQTVVNQGRLVVSSVTANSPSSRLGIQPGDLLEAVNDVPLDESTMLPGGVDIRSVRVRRGGITMTLRF